MGYLVSLRWPDGVKCPRCESSKVHKLSRPWKWQCKQCNKSGYRFSPLAGTIFENTNIPLSTWFRVIFMMTQSKKGMSAHQVYRMIGKQQEGKGKTGGPGSYRTAWYMCHRIRAAMKNNEFFKLIGEVEVDETYVGGKNKNRHRNKKVSGSGTAGKVPVVGAIARKGSIVAKVVEEVSLPTLNRFVKESVSNRVLLVATDERAGYHHLRQHGYTHATVSHSEGEYVRGRVYTANIDSFWSLLKRGIMGNFHHVRKTYAPLYLAEFTFRHNNRKNPDIFGKVVAGC